MALEGKRIIREISCLILVVRPNIPLEEELVYN